MKRHAFAFKVAEGKKGEFRKQLGVCWPQITVFLDAKGLKNFSLWSAAEFGFGYYESADDIIYSAEEKEAAAKIIDSFEGLVEWISRPGSEMRLMYHNFGIVRENKELIRHRVFMTKLKPDCAEEYKRRHDALVEARGDVPDPGPDSNFSIWSDGNYIFGYDEIDTSMETDETPEAHENTVAWETRQLGIMDWITNDCDWLTGEVHADVVRLAYHG